MKVAVLVFGDISMDDGTTVGAKRGFHALAEHFDTSLMATKSDKRID